MTTAVLKLPAWQRRLAPFVVALAATGAMTTVTYFPDGPRLIGGSGLASAPVTSGEEFHYLVHLLTKGGDVTLVKARIFGASGEIRADPPRLLRTTGPRKFVVGGRGPVTVPHDVVELPGARIPRMDSSGGTEYALDFVLRPTTEGAFRVNEVEVTYNAGFLRTRTAVIESSLCLRVSADSRSDPAEVNRLCGWSGP